MDCKYFIRILFLIVTIRLGSSLKGSRILPHFKFGVISDIQYAKSSDAWNFQRTKIRRYRNSLQIYQDALQYWKQVQTQFNLVLGDIVDIRASFSNSQEACLSSLMQSQGAFFSTSNYYCFGNHCLTCFSRLRLKGLVSDNSPQVTFCPPQTNVQDQPLAYYWNPSPHWCFISLDSYDVSVVNPSNLYHEALARRLIETYNPNNLCLGKSWFENLPREHSMWTPNNGGISRNQFLWLDRILQRSATLQQKVILFSHQPVYAPTNPTPLLWNHREVLDLLWKYNHVVLWLAGHDHEGQSHIDEQGIYHLIPPAPIEAEITDQTFGVFEVYDDCLVFDWKGKIPRTRNCREPWPTQIKFK